MSEMVKAMDLALRKGPARMACCPCCPGDVPLIPTIRFSGAEFYCLDCGATVGFVNPKGVEATPELDADYNARYAEWLEHIRGVPRVEQDAWLEERKTR